MRPAARARQVVLQGEDESLRSLLSDVLEDMGLMLSASGEGRGWPDVVLVLVQRGDSLFRVLQQARHEAGSAPVLALLPFDDERLRHLALSLGARGCYALGTPLEQLMGLLRDVVAEAPGLGDERGRHDDGA
jgi:DNA-binding NarL/FixJ family response regulator